MFKDLKIINSKRLEFIIEDIDLSIVNAIRRIIIAEVPNVAINFDPYDIDNNDIKININKGVLHNEYISHRISLIPICLDENEIYNFKKEDYNFILKKKNNTSSVLNLTSGDIDIYNSNDVKYDNKIRDNIFPKNIITGHHILLTKLKPNLYDPNNGDELDIICNISLDISKKHARWCPVSQCCYFNKVDDLLADKMFKDKIDLIKKDKQISKIEIDDIKSQFDTLEKYRYFKRNKYDEPNEFVFLIESECKLRPIYLVFKGLLILMNKFKLFISNLESNNESIDIAQIVNVDNFYQIKVKKEDHTLLNTIQCMIYNQYFRNNKDINILEFIGFFQPHPLDDLMYIKLRFSKDIKVDKEYVKEFMIKAINKNIENIDLVIKEWIKFSNIDKMNIIEVKDYLEKKK